MITIQETSITMKMTVTEADQLYRELASMPSGELEKKPKLKEIYCLLDGLFCST